MLTERIQHLRTTGSASGGPVLLWLNRDRRLHDNWAVIHAQRSAIMRQQHLHVVFCLVPQFLDATWRQYHFLLEGLRELSQSCLDANISFTLLEGAPPDVLPAFIAATAPSLLVSDFDPLRTKQQWLQSVLHSTTVNVDCVDAHNIVPVWTASNKLEFAAYTLRPKLHRLLPTFLEPFPAIERHPFGTATVSADWKGATDRLQVDMAVPPATWITPGESAGRAGLDTFVGRLALYSTHRNDPNASAQSDLSAWFHFGHLAPQRAALEVHAAAAAQPDLKEAADAFLEELIVRRELADNFVYYNGEYDSVAGFHAWARASLDEHRNDNRDYVHDLHTWEHAATHDPLWNAAQCQLLATGKMHGYMRMYWAKKILEWTARPEDAMAIAIYLNDKYELDGRDPNGYAGIAWCIGGVHDRAWFDRPVYGKIRYMNSNGCAKKFDVTAYIAKWLNSTTT